MGLLEFWGFGVLRFGFFGALEFWSFGVVVFWRFGFLVLGFWVFEQVIALPESMRAAGGVAIAANLGGFASGILLTPFLKKKEVRFFQKGHSRAFARNTRRIRR